VANTSLYVVSETSAAGGKRGFEGGALDAETILTVFFPKNTHF